MCENKATCKVITFDEQALPVCETHLSAWLQGGAVLKKNLAVVAGGTLKRYGAFSTLFLIGFSLMFYDVYVWGHTSLTGFFSFVGLVLLVLSWLIFVAVLHKAYTKIRSRTLPGFTKPEKAQQQ